MKTTDRRLGRLVPPAIAALSLAAVGLTACGGSGEGDTADYYPNCVNDQNQVVSPKDCQNSPGTHWIWMAPQRYGTGYTVPGSARSGSGWFRADDQAARSAAGLPKSGSIPEDFKVSSSKGGFDGHAGSGEGGEGGHGDSGGHGGSAGE